MNNDFEKKLNLCLSKLNKEIDLDWIEIIEELGLDIHYDTLRRMAYGYKEYDEYIKSKTKDMLSDEQYQKLLDKELEIKKEKVKLQDIKTCLNKKIREFARHENLGEILKEKMDELNLSPSIINNNYVDKIPSGKQAISMWSDWHYAETTDSFLNKYDPDICRQRVSYLVDKTIEHCKLNNIDILNVFCLGDMISNEHYSTIRLQNRENLISQIINVSELISESIIKLSKYIPYLTISFCNGNHCRVHQKNENLNRDNYTTLIKEFVTLRLKGISNVAFLDNSYDDEIINANICGLNVIGTHGDKVNKKQASYQLSSLLDTKIDVLCLGHYHENSQDINHRTVVYRNGSLVGSNEYSRNLNLHTFPSQTLLILNDGYVECSYNIRLDRINN